MAGEHTGHRQRMRERFVQNGLSGFADHEMLELLLFYAIPQRDVNPLAHRLLARFGSLHAVMDASVEDLCTVEGMGMNAAVLFRLTAELAKKTQLSREDRRKVMKSPEEARLHCMRLLSGLSEERLYAVCMNAQMEILGDVQLSSGSIGEVPVYMREVAQSMLRLGTRMVVLCHNHPGGSIVPSQEDVTVTQRLAEMLRYLDVSLLDHVIVAGTETLSMASHGLIRAEQENTSALSKAAEKSLEWTGKNRK